MPKKILKYTIIILAAWVVLHVIIMFSVGMNDDVQNAGSILIFGNKVETDGRVSARLKSRLDTGIELYRQGNAPLIIVSGGLGKEGYDEALVMKNYLVSHDIPAENIIEDPLGINTHETAKKVSEIVKNTDIDGVIIVTQYYHVLRAKLALKRFGVAPVYSAHARMFPELRDIYSISREIVAYYVYLLKAY